MECHAPVVASKLYNVPRTTLTGKIKGTYLEECNSGVSTVLTSREDDILVNWILNMAKMGFPINKDQLLDSVTMLRRELKRHNKFNDGRPGRHWFEELLKRHPQISLRMSENLTASRVAVTAASIKNWFDEVQKYFISTNTFVNDPNRIFNADEPAFFLFPKGNAVLAKKGSNANGVLAPPMVMYPYDRIPKHIVMRVPNGWGIGKSDSGWMTSESFFGYMYI
ncbi:tc5 transposase dna-binding domain [Holotrichia oblita]|uniref:Tc5 transposase dna-binding domain n=1 Tax=Holotrichia oblita TaxID=644536 RepID=A0ACB9T8P5_HOLOL|nr:tc5 transposase dna-binding domain [Holotrichia oblita]